MSIYGKNMFTIQEEYNYIYENDNNIMKEAAIFLSSEGKTIKNKIKEIISQYKTKGFFNNLRKSFTIKGYDKDIAKKIQSEIKPIFECIHFTNIVKCITYYTSSSGITTESITYEQKAIAVKGKYVYTFLLSYGTNSASLQFLSFNEKNIDKFI